MSGRVPLGVVSTVDALANDVRSRVLDGIESPGSSLREAELCSLYGVSRNSLRAALQRLVHEGLLRHEPNRGVFVPRLTLADAEDIYRVRMALETEAARVLTERHLPLDGIVGSVDRLAQIGGDASWGTVLEADLDVHRAIIDSVGSSRLSRAFASLVGEMRLCLIGVHVLSEDYAQLLDDHRLLVDALANREPTVAVNAVREHLDAALAQVVESSSDP